MNFGDGMFTKLFQPVLNRIHKVGTMDGNRTDDTIKEIRHSMQKEKRIIDTLEPVLNRHKLIIDRKVVENDYRSVQCRPSEVANQYMGLYQLTRITRDRGSLTHEDRLDALAMAVAYWTDSMARDVDKSVEDRKTILLKASLRSFMKSAKGLSDKPLRWI